MMIMSIDVRDDVIHSDDDEEKKRIFVKIEKAKKFLIIKNTSTFKIYNIMYIGKDRKLHYRIYTTDEWGMLIKL